MLMCTTSCTSSPWHNFVSDTEHWKDGTGSIPCLNNGGMYPSQVPFMASMKLNGAKNIFTPTTDAVFSGTPSPSKLFVLPKDLSILRKSSNTGSGS